jgi:coenzyme F420-0:L-glutamate ligase / coenzyme F420-1:gamma-L-glutamate ligase
VTDHADAPGSGHGQPVTLPTLQVFGVVGLPEINPGDDLAALVAERAELRNGDVVVAAQKIVSKAEGAMVAPRPGEPPDAARRRLAHAEAVTVVAETDRVLVVRTRHGFVCANGGVDASNVPGGMVTLLPADPDASAARLRAGLAERGGVDVAVVVADTFGRPWRQGQTDVAIGVAGLAPIRDERGGTDRLGNRLDVTEVAVADELAAAADLVRRKADGVPVVVIRGFDWDRDEEAGARALIRRPEEDLFPRGMGGLGAALAAATQAEPAVQRSAGVEPGDLRRLLDVVRRHTGDDPPLSVDVADGAPTRVAVRPSQRTTASSAAWAEAGVAAGLLTALLADLGYATARHTAPDGTLLVEAGSPQRRR